MKNLLRLGRCFYGIGIIGLGIQQFIYSNFRPVLLASWPSSFPGVSVWAYITGAVLILTGVFITRYLIYTAPLSLLSHLSGLNISQRPVCISGCMS